MFAALFARSTLGELLGTGEAECAEVTNGDLIFGRG